MCRYYITDGAKFGADYLLYPGDPMLFHAQFTVQPIKCEQNIAAPLLLGSARGSHAARKHLLLATVSILLLSSVVFVNGSHQRRMHCRRTTTSLHTSQ